MDVAKPKFDDLSRGAHSLGKQRRRIEAESLENDPDDKRDDNQSQRDHRRRSPEEPADSVGHDRQFRSADRPAACLPLWPPPARSNVGSDLGLIDQDFGNCTIDEGFGWEEASSSPPTSLPLIVRRPCETPSLIVEPSLSSPASNICASGSCTHFWITRFKGRAP